MRQKFVGQRKDFARALKVESNRIFGITYSRNSSWEFLVPRSRRWTRFRILYQLDFPKPEFSHSSITFVTSSASILSRAFFVTSHQRMSLIFIISILFVFCPLVIFHFFYKNWPSNWVLSQFYIKLYTKCFLEWTSVTTWSDLLKLKERRNFKFIMIL